MQALPQGPLAQRRGGRVRPRCGGLEVNGMDAVMVPGSAGVRRDAQNALQLLDDTTFDPGP